MGPLISVIIPSFNQGAFIAQTIDSILQQSYKQVEILVIDGGSTDQTLDILRSYGDQIFWLSEPDRGQAHAINKGLAMAKGDVIAYLNSDDYYLDGTLEKVASVLTSGTEERWLTGDYLIVDEQGKNIQSFVVAYKRFFRRRLSFNVLSVLNPIVQPSTFMTRSMTDATGTFNEELHYTMDYDYWLRAIRIEKPVILQDRLAAFRVHKASKGGSQYNAQFAEELAVARKYTINKWLVFLHTFHNECIKSIYRKMK
jgi:glycosyltransferase involved in cell wall biosynthesis